LVGAVLVLPYTPRHEYAGRRADEP